MIAAVVALLLPGLASMVNAPDARAFSRPGLPVEYLMVPSPSMGRDAIGTGRRNHPGTSDGRERLLLGGIRDRSATRPRRGGAWVVAAVNRFRRAQDQCGGGASGVCPAGLVESLGRTGDRPAGRRRRDRAQLVAVMAVSRPGEAADGSSPAVPNLARRHRARAKRLAAMEAIPTDRGLFSRRPGVSAEIADHPHCRDDGDRRGDEEAAPDKRRSLARHHPLGTFCLR